MSQHRSFLIRIACAASLLLVCSANSVRAQSPAVTGAPAVTWQVESIPASSNDYTTMGFAVDAGGTVHMTFQDSTEAPNHKLVYATRSGGGWQTKIVAEGLYVGTSSDIALKPDGEIAIAYTDDNSVMLATPDILTGWKLDVVEAVSKHMFLNVGLGFDSAGVPQVGYWDWDDRTVRYAQYNEPEDKWDVETVEKGTHPQFHVDETGTPHFVFSQDGQLRHSMRLGPGWSFEPLGSGISGYVAWKGSEPCHAYTYDGSSLAGLHYRCGSAGPEVLVDSAGAYPVLGISPTGAPHILYTANGQRVYAVLHGSSWISETVGQDLGSINNAHLVIDGSNRAKLGYKDGNQPKYALTDGSIVPQSEFALSPDKIVFVTHFAAAKPDTVVVTRYGEPASTDNTFDVALQVKGKQDVEWEVKAPAWAEVTPAKGKGPATLKIGLKFKPDEVKVMGERTGKVTVQSTDGRISAQLDVTVKMAPRRYIDPPATKLVEHLRGLMYTEAPDPNKSTRPVGSVILWGDPGSASPAHSTVVINETDQTGMRLAVLVDDRYGKPAKGVGEYAVLAVWEPPTNSFNETRIPPAYLSTSLPREYNHPARKWNCHGYSSTLVYFGFEPTMRADKNASVSVQPGAITVNQGKVWYRGATHMKVSTPPGPFDVHSECMVDVKSDGSVEFHLLDGSATFQGASGDVVLAPNEMLVVDADGEPGPVTDFDPTEVDRWWERIDVEDYGLYLPSLRTE